MTISVSNRESVCITSRAAAAKNIEEKGVGALHTQYEEVAGIREGSVSKVGLKKTGTFRLSKSCVNF